MTFDSVFIKQNKTPTSFDSERGEALEVTSCPKWVRSCCCCTVYASCTWSGVMATVGVVMVPTLPCLMCGEVIMGRPSCCRTY